MKIQKTKKIDGYLITVLENTDSIYLAKLEDADGIAGYEVGPFTIKKDFTTREEFLGIKSGGQFGLSNIDKCFGPRRLTEATEYYNNVILSSPVETK